MNELTQRGINALKAGDRSTARLLLGAALKQDPNDATAWLWLTGALTNDEERIQCLQQVLRIDPGNAVAARGLAQILERRTNKAAAAPQEAAPQEVAEPTIVESPQEIAEPQQEVAEPPQEISETKREVGGTQQEISEPEREVANSPQVISEPQREVVKSEGEVAEGQQNVAEPEQEIAEPEQEVVERGQVVEIPQQVAEMPQTVSEPRQEIATPEQEIAEPEQVVAGSQKTEAETTTDADSTDAPATAAFAGLDQASETRRRRKQAAAAAAGERVIFRTRPSLVLALMGFWTFLIGAVVVGVLLRDSPVLSLTLGIGLVLFLELIFVYAVIRIMSIRYELTDQTLLLRFRGKRVRLPHSDIYSAECRQNAIQQMLGTGDIHLRAAVKGELADVRIHNIPECVERTKQIQSYIKPAE